MKKGILIFCRVIFVILAILTVTYLGLKYYFQFESGQAIKKSLLISSQMTDMPVIGDKNNPFTIVEFFDYRCPHCSTVSKLVENSVGQDINKDTKIILRPVVISDNESEKIASFVLAADLQKSGETLKLHKQIMALSAIPSFDSVKAMAAARGLDVVKGESDAEGFKGILRNNLELLTKIGFYGVPALIIGDKGFMPESGLTGINEMRLMMMDAKTRLETKN